MRSAQPRQTSEDRCAAPSTLARHGRTRPRRARARRLRRNRVSLAGEQRIGDFGERRPRGLLAAGLFLAGLQRRRRVERLLLRLLRHDDEARLVDALALALGVVVVAALDETLADAADRVVALVGEER